MLSRNGDWRKRSRRNVYSPAELFILTQRRRERRVHTEDYYSHRTDRAASAERCLHQLCQVVMEEGEAKSDFQSDWRLYFSITEETEINGKTEKLGEYRAWRKPKKNTSRPFDGASLP